jgi:hypothetical protein
MWEIVNSGKYHCWRITMRTARARLKATPHLPPLIRYIGSKPKWPCSNAQRLDFYLTLDEHGRERPDYSIDPIWSGNPNPNP